MSVIRHESQQYATPAALAAENVVPTLNDEVHVESLNRRFNWLEGSTSTADDKYVIEQVSESANGRWVATAVEGAVVYTGSATTDDIPNGSTSVVKVAMTGAGTLLVASGAAIAVTNGSAIPANVFVESTLIKGDNSIEITVVNESGVTVPAFLVELKAIDYTGVAAAAAPAKKTEFGSVVNNNNNDVVITFTTPFTSAPFLTLTAIGDGSKTSDFFASSPTTTGFTLKRGYMMNSGGLIDIKWKAEEK